MTVTLTVRRLYVDCAITELFLLGQQHASTTSSARHRCHHEAHQHVPELTSIGRLTCPLYPRLNIAFLPRTRSVMRSVPMASMLKQGVRGYAHACLTSMLISDFVDGILASVDMLDAIIHGHRDQQHHHCWQCHRQQHHLQRSITVVVVITTATTASFAQSYVREIQVVGMRRQRSLRTGQAQ